MTELSPYCVSTRTNKSNRINILRRRNQAMCTSLLAFSRAGWVLLQARMYLAPCLSDNLTLPCYSFASLACHFNPVRISPTVPEKPPRPAPRCAPRELPLPWHHLLHMSATLSQCGCIALSRCGCIALSSRCCCIALSSQCGCIALSSQ